ncbi:MAG: hypothetical protein ACFFBP_10290 [Promethearchaeota archaeon]
MSKHKSQTVGREDNELKFDVGTIVFFIIGFIVSWINMLIIRYLMTIPSYLSVIFTTSIPGIIIALKNRYWGYGFMFGFSIAGIPFTFIDIFIGGYIFSTALFIFIIMWLIFWRAWRSLSSIKLE